jgi:hypothetical protein
MRALTTDKGIRRGRRLIDPNLQVIDCGEVNNVAATARVTVMLKPSERQSIFDRITFRGSNLDREAINYKVSRADVLNAFRVETRTRLKQERELGYIEARRENLLPPSGPGIAAWPSRRMAA